MTACAVLAQPERCHQPHITDGETEARAIESSFSSGSLPQRGPLAALPRGVEGGGHRLAFPLSWLTGRMACPVLEGSLR
jgi:hypothetical protein